MGPTGQVIGLDVMRACSGWHAPSRPRSTRRSPTGRAVRWPSLSRQRPWMSCSVNTASNFFPDRGHSVQEMGRVLRPEGRVGVRVWRALDISPRSRVGGPRSASVGWPGRPESPRLCATLQLGDAEQLDAVMRDAGLHAIDVQVSTMPIRLGANATISGILRLTSRQRDYAPWTIRRAGRCSRRS